MKQIINSSKMLLFMMIVGLTFFSAFPVSAQGANSMFTAKNFSSKDATEVAKNQKSIAIVPVAVSIAANAKITAEELQEQQRTESANFQRAIYSWMLKRKMKKAYALEIQEIEVTNAKLKDAGYPETMLTNTQLCEILGVDGIILSSFNLSKPVSQGAAIAASLALGMSLSTNQIQATLSSFDNSKKDIFWMYGNKISGGLGSTPTTIVDQLMKKASKKMPYFKK